MAGLRDKLEAILMDQLGSIEFDKLKNIERERRFTNSRETLRFLIGLYDHSAPNPTPNKLQRTVHVK